jgi:hypothetical protein
MNNHTDLNLIKDELALTDTKIGQMLIYKNDYIISYALMALGEYCHQEIDIMCTYLNKDSLYLDIGTNIGYHAKAVHLQSGGCSVIAFEPHPTHFRVAEYNCSNLSIAIFNAAVGDGSTSTTTISDFDVSKSDNYGEVKMIEGDLTHSWSTVGEALESGKFNYLWDMYTDGLIDFHPDELHNCKSVEEMIKMVGFPFEISN